MGNIFYKCKNEDEEELIDSYKKNETKIIYNIPLSKNEKKRKKYRLNKKIKKQYEFI